MTLELLGVASVEPEQVERDAAGLLQMLTRCGALAGDAPAMAAMTTPTQFEGVKFVRAPHAGIVVYHAELGDRIEAGQVVAELIDPANPDPACGAREIRSGTAGVLFCRRHTLLVRPDDVVAKVAGPVPLAEPKHY